MRQLINVSFITVLLLDDTKQICEKHQNFQFFIKFYPICLEIFTDVCLYRHFMVWWRVAFSSFKPWQISRIDLISTLPIYPLLKNMLPHQSSSKEHVATSINSHKQILEGYRGATQSYLGREMIVGRHDLLRDFSLNNDPEILTSKAPSSSDLSWRPQLMLSKRTRGLACKTTVNVVKEDLWTRVQFCN